MAVKTGPLQTKLDELADQHPHAFLRACARLTAVFAYAVDNGLVAEDVIRKAGYTLGEIEREL